MGIDTYPIEPNRSKEDQRQNTKIPKYQRLLAIERLRRSAKRNIRSNVEGSKLVRCAWSRQNGDPLMATNASSIEQKMPAAQCARNKWIARLNAVIARGRAHELGPAIRSTHVNVHAITYVSLLGTHDKQPNEDGTRKRSQRKTEKDGKRGWSTS